MAEPIDEAARDDLYPMKRAAEHDRLCHAAALDWHATDCCDCEVIARARTDMAEEFAAVFADERAELRASGERNDIRDHPLHRVRLKALDSAHGLALEYAREHGGEEAVHRVTDYALRAVGAWPYGSQRLSGPTVVRDVGNG